MEWYLSALKKYAEFNGRSRRTEFWMFQLINLLVSFVVGFLSGVLFGESGLILANLYSLAVLLPTIAVGVRRMHDTGRSGWWILLPIANIVFWAEDSQLGDNKYGPNPKVVASAPVETSSLQRTHPHLFPTVSSVVASVQEPMLSPTTNLTAVPILSSQTAKSSLEIELEKAAKLLEDQLIDEEEYRTLKKKIIERS
ncbi:DUF805 domain-containing protein [bacterium]|nr:DUF805 domain-containing protein [bacterium]